jgi:hypothetical protein
MTNIDAAYEQAPLAFYDSTESWQTWIEGRLGQEREYTSALMTEVIRGLVADLDARVNKALIDLYAATRPQNGLDGRSFDIVGTYSPQTRYRALQVVALNGSSFAARQDDPGPCPGSGWQLIACQGKRGPIGPKGDAGLRGCDGRDAPKIVGWEIDDKTYTAVPRFADGTYGPTLELRKLFERFITDTSE